MRSYPFAGSRGVVWLRRGVLLLGVVFGTFMGSSAVAVADSASCQGADVQVSQTVPVGRMHGTLCVPPGGSSTVMVLVPGATYNHTYWDFPYQPQIYNFRQALNADGYATFAVDRLGTGDSSRPPSAALSATVQAVAVHDVISALRAGQIGGTAFPKVIVGGHSLGSAIAIIEAATFNDDSAVLLTGWSHFLNEVNLAGLLASATYPAALDPKFAGQGYDPGYLTTRPGQRGTYFYAPQTTDPDVLAEDDATKDVVSTTEAADAVGVAAATPYSTLIKAPVLIADGQLDALVCTPAINNCANAQALKATEAPYFLSTSCLKTYVLPNAGHDINLATDTQEYQQAVRSWADAFVGTGPGNVNPPVCGS
jgi:pimeloyl-ACP methyl ester carboxylesterase